MLIYQCTPLINEESPGSPIKTYQLIKKFPIASCAQQTIRTGKQWPMVILALARNHSDMHDHMILSAFHPPPPLPPLPNFRDSRNADSSIYTKYTCSFYYPKTLGKDRYRTTRWILWSKCNLSNIRWKVELIYLSLGTSWVTSHAGQFRVCY